nr:response regulator [Lachnospiraceae bacterium]
WVIRGFLKEKNNKSRYRFFMLILAFGVQIFSFILHLSGILSISDYYDITMPGALIGTVFMLVGIIGFDLLGTREIARDFVIDRISEGIIAVDNDGRIQYYNEPAARLYPEFDAFFSAKDERGEQGLYREDPAKENLLNTLLKRNNTPYDILSAISEAVKTGKNLKVYDRIYKPVENELLYKGEKYGKLYALVDDTEHYNYLKELQKQRDIADSANEAKSRFLASMSHEIRTPINAVLGFDEMILRESSEKTIRKYASDIMSAGKTLLSLINDILDLSKVEEGKMEIILKQYELTSLINDLNNMTRARAEKKGLKFNIEVNDQIPHMLLGDEVRIRQCVINLLTNAVKYTEKGSVTLSVTYSKPEEESKASAILLSFKVEDTGIGMKKEDLEDFFSPYKRIREERNPNIEGTGLGISITKQLLELMDSRLEVDSEYGKGTKISFAIRQEVISWDVIGDYRVRVSDMGADEEIYKELFHAPEGRILVVDDTEMNIEVIKSLLKKTLITIDTALSGREAIVLALENKYDAIFIDHMMPDMDGIETLENIRGSEINELTPAIALTANAVTGARENYLNAGFTDYLSKPVDGRKLEKMLKKLLPEDKLLTPDIKDGEEEKEEEKEKEEIPEWLTDIAELNTDSGVKNCDGVSGYLSVLSAFHKTAEYKADEIEELFKDRDLKNYTIKVHALKSSARIIGARDMAMLAENLEKAGNEGNMVIIGENTERLLEMYRKLDTKLSVLDLVKDELPLIEEKTMREAYQTMAEIGEIMDYQMMYDLLKEVRKYRLEKKDEEKVNEIEKLLAVLDWDGITAQAKSMFI